MSDSFQHKQKIVLGLFAACPDKESKYNKIIEMGRLSFPLASCHRNERTQVHGCQSLMYLHTYLKDGKIYFEAESDALISSGLAALLTQVYSGELPELVLKNPPNYLEELGIVNDLSPNRANGLSSIYLKMRQDSFKALHEILF